jgi:hypothetical protein
MSGVCVVLRSTKSQDWPAGAALALILRRRSASARHLAGGEAHGRCELCELESELRIRAAVAQGCGTREQESGSITPSPDLLRAAGDAR